MPFTWKVSPTRNAYLTPEEKPDDHSSIRSNMKQVTYQFSQAATRFYFDARFSPAEKITDPAHTVLVTDENVLPPTAKSLKAGIPLYSNQAKNTKGAGNGGCDHRTTDRLPDRPQTTWLGIGGGDHGYHRVCGFGLHAGFALRFYSSLLLGARGCIHRRKERIDVGYIRTWSETIRQPGFILHDMDFLGSLPDREWENGRWRSSSMPVSATPPCFANWKRRTSLFTAGGAQQTRRPGVAQCPDQDQVVQRDEFEKAERRLLNLAIPRSCDGNQYELMHGQAVAIGMAYAR